MGKIGILLWTVGVMVSCKEGPVKSETTGSSEKAMETAWEPVVSKDGSKPVQRHEAAFTRVGQKFYLLGGRGIRPVSIYDPATGGWSSGPEPPLELHHFQPVVHKNKIYVVAALTGGWPNETPTQYIYSYDTATDTWEKGAKIPEDRRRGATGNVLYQGRIYISCGIKNGHIGDHKKWMDSYDLTTGEWKILADAPRTRDHFQAVETKGKIYALAGRNTGALPNEPFGATIGPVDVYDIENDTWQTLPHEIPTQRAGTMSIVHGDEILVLGGESSSQEKAHAQVEALAKDDHTWRSLPPMIQGRHGTGVLQFQGGLYVASGCGNRGGQPELFTMERLTGH
ncbi:MAG: kelch repeat-containing protein [Bacteroidota bacterium]